ncbi:PadR family transcriptional regulator [Microbacterium sp. ASV49]|uniref:PadR family transcriptional regulator n=1 Tax=Microbacterium candidum TaxID=3041922 RepID=A0ABT7MY05_9MICO|nr:PadR family transcriptional regulator [Microbacterium sp. ASV49]MDL9979338.1 PadR family transcriptional regulator [Microbacterium sp. ASV49]
MDDDAEVVTADEAELPATSWAVLGILSFGEQLSGYDIKRWAEQSLAFFYWAPSQSQIYTELRRLESHGLVVSRVEQTHEAKSRRLYEITDTGRRWMRDWADRLEPDPVVLKHPVLLRVWAAHNGDRTRLLRVLDDYRDEVLARAERAEQHRANSSAVPGWRYSSIALGWSTRYLQDEAARIGWLREQIENEDEES